MVQLTERLLSLAGIEVIAEDQIKGGYADGKTLKDIAIKFYGKKYTEKQMKALKHQLKLGVKEEMEHTDSRSKSKEIAMDHLWENPEYYKGAEAKEDKEEEKFAKMAKKNNKKT